MLLRAIVRPLRLVLVTALALTSAACGGPVVTNAATQETPTPEGSPTPAGSPTPTPTPAGGPLCGTSNPTTTQGGTLDCLSFAIVGDTRPPAIDDTTAYPKAIITKIYQDIENAPGGRPSFALSTGDYIFASSTGTQAATQMGYYLTAQQNYSGLVYHAMGNHECTGATNSNCATATTSNHNYSTFMSKMMTPLGNTKPYYAVHFQATDASWTAKFVFVAANAWDTAQATWLDSELSNPTTYTFVVRHESNTASTAPGVTPSKHIIDVHPYTMLLLGHTHIFEYLPTSREVITGIGGAPLTGSINYGYVLVRQRQDGAIDFDVRDYQSGSSMQHFVVTKTGTPTQ